MANVSESIARLTPGPRLSQGVVHRGLLCTSGQFDRESTEVWEQTKKVLAKIDAPTVESRLAAPEYKVEIAVIAVAGKPQ